MEERGAMITDWSAFVITSRNDLGATNGAQENAIQVCATFLFGTVFWIYSMQYLMCVLELNTISHVCMAHVLIVYTWDMMCVVSFL